LTDCTTVIHFVIIGHQKTVESLIAWQVFSHQEIYHFCLGACCGFYMCPLHRINLFLYCTVYLNISRSGTRKWR